MEIDQENQALAIIEMRDELANTKSYLETRNKIALKASLRACQSDARRFFKGDDDSIRDFTSKLQAIYNAFKTRKYDEAVELNDKLHKQIKMLIMEMHDSTALPDSAAQQRQKVTLAENVTERDEHSFDLAAGRYCQNFFAEIPSDRDTLMMGLMWMVQGIFSERFVEGVPSIEFIRNKRAQDKESNLSIQVAVAFSKRLAENSELKKLRETVESTSTPAIAYLTDRIVKAIDKVVFRKQPPEVITSGYVSDLSWMVIQISLCLQHLLPQTTREFALELEKDSQAKLSSESAEKDSFLTELSDEELKQLVFAKCIEYGVGQDGSQIQALFQLYKLAMKRLSVSDRMQVLNELIIAIEDGKGRGHMGLMMFIAAEDAPGIISTAAMSLALLFPVQDGFNISGPNFVVNNLLELEKVAEHQAAALGGILLLGDRRILPLLGDAWSKISETARLELTHSKSGFVTECVVEFWLRCLEGGCSESVFGSVVAAIAKLPSIAQQPFVFDVQRVFPVYADSDNPMRLIRQSTFDDYLKDIRHRLEAIEETESEPKVIPKIYDLWAGQ